jgi:hypothetical protein
LDQNSNGQLIEKREGLAPADAITIGDRYIDGIYLIEVVQGKNRKILKLVKI